MLGGAAIFALMMVFAIQRLPGETIPPPAPVPVQAEARFDAAWSDSFQTAVAKKQDKVRQIEMAVATDPKLIPTERIMPDAPAKVPPVVLVKEEEERPAVRHRRHHRIRVASVDTESNVCVRHKMHKVYTRGGKSWRCRK